MRSDFPSSEVMRKRLGTLKDPDPKIRQESIYHLARSVVHVEDVVASIANALEDEDVEVCREAAVALFMFGARAKTVTPAIIAALRHPDLIVRRAAAAT